MILYLDAAVLVPLGVIEPMSETIRTWLEARDEQIAVGRLAVAEMGSAISRRRRMDALTENEAELALTRLDSWIGAATTVVDHEPQDLIEAAKLVRRAIPKLLTPDAIHLATCRRLGYRLVTTDKDLTIAADVHGIAWRTPL